MTNDIPTSAAQSLAEQYGKDMIVILAYDCLNNADTVVTWGRDLAQSEYAANAGNDLKIAIGWKPEDCRAVSAKVQQVIDAKLKMAELLSRLQYKIENETIGYAELSAGIDEILKIAR